MKVPPHASPSRESPARPPSSVRPARARVGPDRLWLEHQRATSARRVQLAALGAGVAALVLVVGSSVAGPGSARPLDLFAFALLACVGRLSGMTYGILAALAAGLIVGAAAADSAPATGNVVATPLPHPVITTFALVAGALVGGLARAVATRSSARRRVREDARKGSKD